MCASKTIAVKIPNDLEDTKLFGHAWKENRILLVLMISGVVDQ